MHPLRLGLLSDIHSNLAAVSAVQAALTTEEPLDAVLVAGDLLQGGPRPREVWQTLADNRWILVQGNEDAVIAGLLPPTLDPGHPYQKPYLACQEWSLSQIDASIQRYVYSDAPERSLAWLHQKEQRTTQRRGWRSLITEDCRTRVRAYLVGPEMYGQGILVRGRAG